MTKRILMLTCAFGAASALSCAGRAAAADAPAGPTATEVGAIIVTAEKREQNLQKVPVAVTAFTGKDRDKLGIVTLQDMTNFAPGLTYNGSLDHLYVRGEGRQSANLGADAGVATYVDGFYSPDPIIAIDPPLFSQNVEVLRGPQGTLSGRNGIGGALLITSVRPTSTPYAEARVTIENYGYYDYEAAVSGPITDGLNVRLAGWGRTQNQGYYKSLDGGPSEGNVLNDYHLEASTTAKLGENLDLFVRAFTYSTDDRGGPGGRTGYSPDALYDGLYDQNSKLYFNPAFAFGGAAVDPMSRTGAPGSPGALVQNPAIANPYNFMAEQTGRYHTRDAANINYILTYHFDGFDLKYTGGYQQYTYIQNSDPSPINVGIQETDATSFLVPLDANPNCIGGAAGCLQVNPSGLNFHYVQKEAWYSQEAVLQSTAAGPLQWVAGLFYYHEQYSNPISESDSAQSQVLAPCYLTNAQVGSLLGPTPGAVPATATAQCPAGGSIGVVNAPLNPSGALDYQTYNFTEESKAVFGQVDYKITNQFKLTGGLRYTSDTKGGTEYNRSIDFGGDALGLYQSFIQPNLFGPYTPAIDLTPLLCALQANIGTGQGVKSPCVVNYATGIASRTLGGSSSAVTGTAGVEWTPDRSTLAYIRYSRGYKELGFNAGFLAQVAEVAPETVNDYELGVKKSFGHNLVVDADIFYEDFADFQDQLVINLPVNGPSNSFVSIPRARSDGFELEAIWTPVNNLLFNLSYAFDDSGFPNKCNQAHATTDSNCFQDIAVNNPSQYESANGELPNTPKNKVSLAGQYSWVFEPGKLTFMGTYIWRDQQFGSIFNEPWYQAPSWSQVNLRLTWAARGDRYEVSAFGDNVFNTIGYAAGAYAYAEGDPLWYEDHGAPNTQAKYYYINAPATYGVEFHYKFF